MKKITENKENSSVLHRLLGEPDAAKTSGLSYSIATVLPAILSFLFLTVIAATGATKQENYQQQDWYLYVSFLLPQIAFALVALFALRYEKKGLQEAFYGQKCAPKYFIWAIVLQIGLVALSELNTLFLSFLERFGYQDSGIHLPNMDGIGFFGVVFAVAVLPALFEEIVFRGLLLKGLRSFGTVGAVLICGGLFSLYHQNPAQTIYQFCCGAAYALVAIRAGSILPTMLAHFLNNALVLLLTKFGISTFTLPVAIVVLAVSAVCLVTALGYLIFFDKPKTEKEVEKEPKTQRKTFFLFAAVGIVICAITWFSVLLLGM